ncbi:MAG: isoaspartyl peptidase/L-asparaginase [Deltaproteobacteria bacterium]|nr:isoaspartyl peptidase/L-asparaginase [Deltaproteobacteria bacterium]
MSAAIVVHGGAGLIAEDRHARLLGGVRNAASAGHAVLLSGGSALDAVVAAVRVLEDDPEFNAGVGSALTRDGTVETDAAVMSGHDQRIGAVGAVPDLGNAIALAHAVLERGEHVLLAGAAALAFAAEVGITPAAPGALITERARARLAEYLAAPPPFAAATVGTKTAGGRDAKAPRAARASKREREGGTVGAVARDRNGQFAAATSTGGMVGKRSGRIGDSPIVGAGTWADRELAISATGDGEAILRVGLARTVALRAEGSGLEAGARGALAELAAITGGTAGLIAIGRRGHVMLRQTPTMPVAWIDASGPGDSLGDD